MGLTQEEFAKLLSISRPSISNYESVNRLPDAESLDQMRSEAGCSIEYLFGYSDNMNPEHVSLADKIGLSDRAITSMKSAPVDALNFLLEHFKFPVLVHGLDQYTPDTLSNSEEMAFAKYRLVQTFGEIVDDFFRSNLRVDEDSLNSDEAKLVKSIANRPKERQTLIRKALDEKLGHPTE